MQTIKHSYQNLHRIFTQLEQFYTYTSQKEHHTLVQPVFDDSLQELSSIFADYGNIEMPTFQHTGYTKLDVPKNDKDVIVCFSGGKDSTVVAMKYRDAGYNVYLYTATHINPSFSDEEKSAREVAEILGLPIYVDDIHLSGYHCWIEHPMKNMIIANGALHYGINNNIGTRIVFGNYTTSYLEDNPFDRCAGDCVDMWKAYDYAIQQVIDGYHTEFNLSDMTETLQLISPHRDLLDATLSCLCRHSLRPYRHEWVLNKFGINLPKHRCGSCYKCCVEYLYLADHDYIEFSEAYYKYCLSQLKKVLRTEGVEVYTIYDIWDAYLFYPMRDSKLFDELLGATLTIGGIKW